MKITLSKENVKKWFKDKGDFTHNLNHKLGKESIVLDIGAYTGEWISLMSEKYDCYFYAAEPIHRFHEVLYNRFINNKKIQTVMAGIGVVNEKTKINISNDGSSILQDGKASEQIILYDLTTFMEIYKINKIDLVQINIEGLEYELLKDWIDKKNLKYIKKIQIQFHQVEGLDYVKEREFIKKSLIECGFSNCFEYPFVWEAWER